MESWCLKVEDLCSQRQDFWIWAADSRDFYYDQFWEYLYFYSNYYSNYFSTLVIDFFWSAMDQVWATVCFLFWTYALPIFWKCFDMAMPFLIIYVVSTEKAIFFWKLQQRINQFVGYDLYPEPPFVRAYEQYEENLVKHEVKQKRRREFLEDRKAFRDFLAQVIKQFDESGRIADEEAKKKRLKAESVARRARRDRIWAMLDKRAHEEEDISRFQLSVRKVWRKIYYDQCSDWEKDNPDHAERHPPILKKKFQNVSWKRSAFVSRYRISDTPQHSRASSMESLFNPMPRVSNEMLLPVYKVDNLPDDYTDTSDNEGFSTDSDNPTVLTSVLPSENLTEKVRLGLLRRNIVY